MDKVKPCPFCGGDARFYYMKRHWWTRRNPFVFVACKVCHATSNLKDTIAEAEKVWNTRTKERGD